MINVQQYPSKKTHKKNHTQPPTPPRLGDRCSTVPFKKQQQQQQKNSNEVNTSFTRQRCDGDRRRGFRQTPRRCCGTHPERVILGRSQPSQLVRGVAHIRGQGAPLSAGVLQSLDEVGGGGGTRWQSCRPPRQTHALWLHAADEQVRRQRSGRSCTATSIKMQTGNKTV